MAAPSPAQPVPAHDVDPFLDRAGPVCRSLEQRFEPVPAVLPLFAIVAVGWIAMVVVLLGAGDIITHLGAFGGLREWDESVTRWMAGHRTGFLNSVTGLLSRAADTMGVVVFALVVEVVLVFQRRWWPLLVAPIALGLELVTFLTVNALVGRPRPNVPKLGSEPSTSSFPSGHTAATVVLWGTVALLFCSAPTYRWVRSTAAGVVVVLTAAVGTARVYRGMHHPTDVIVGASMGVAALTVTVLAVRVTVLRVRAKRHEPVEASTRQPRPHVTAVS